MHAAINKAKLIIYPDVYSYNITYSSFTQLHMPLLTEM